MRNDLRELVLELAVGQWNVLDRFRLVLVNLYWLFGRHRAPDTLELLQKATPRRCT
jgi:hypothetical protein